MSLTFDASDFTKKFKDIAERAVPKLVVKGIGRAMGQILNDCINEVPTVPIREGWLRGSGSYFVQNALVGVSTVGKSGRANVEHSERIAKNEFLGIIGFNTPYAAKMHEGLNLRFVEPSSGPKYLESKMMRNKERYMKIVADAIKEGGK